MLKRWGVLLLLLAGITPARAQVQAVVGPSGIVGSTVGLGVSGGIEARKGPVESDTYGTFYPFVGHSSMGGGFAWSAQTGTDFWIKPAFGLNAAIEKAQYSVRQTSAHVLTKSAYYLTVGPTFKQGYVWVTLSYLRQVGNGIAPDGTESNHEQGGEVTLAPEFGHGRLEIQLALSRILDQGNPVCDGSYGTPVTCPRSASISGFSSITYYFEFPFGRK